MNSGHADHTDTDTRWQAKTLKAAGYGYVVGDAALALSGLWKGKAGREVFATGAIWAAGGAGAAVWGNPDTEKQLDILAHKLERHLRQSGAVVTDETRSHAQLLHGNNTLGAQLNRFLHTHPTELLNAAYAVGAGVLLHKGTKDFKAGKGVTTNAAMGALVLAGALGGLLIKEDPQARGKADMTSLTSRTVAYIKEKPMRFSSVFYLANNIFTVKNAHNDFENFGHITKLGLKPHHFSTLTAAAYILANGLLFTTTRDQIEEKKFQPEHIAQLEQAAAAIIAAQPPERQAALLSEVSHYLAAEKMVAMPPAQLAQQLVARVGEISQAQLATQVSWAERRANESRNVALSV